MKIQIRRAIPTIACAAAIAAMPALADDEIKVLWETSPGMLRITVSDTGEGIAPLDLYHIFKRFYRAPASGNTPGVGLGLPLARAIVEGQGGTLSVQSEPGAGTAFTATFLTKL